MPIRKKELNEFLQPKDAPVANRKKLIPAMEFDYLSERGAITSSIIQDSNVTAEKLASDAIGTAALADNSVTTSKIASEAVTTAKIAPLNVTTAKIAGSAVTDAKINDFKFSKGSGTITSATINTSQIGTSTMIGGTVKNAVIGTCTVEGGTLDNTIVGSPTITGGTINPTQYQALGTAGATGTIDTSGTNTLIIHNGLIVSIT
jgi:hypothetical protein